MKAISFFFREGSSVLFSIYLLVFALTDFCVVCAGTGAEGMFAVAVVCMIYLSLQSGMAAFSKVGNDGPIFDFFFSITPLFILLMIAVLTAVKAATLTSFEVLGLLLAFFVTMIDVIFNTQVVFKMNRLATDMVQMK